MSLWLQSLPCACKITALVVHYSTILHSSPDDRRTQYPLTVVLLRHYSFLHWQYPTCIQICGVHQPGGVSRRVLSSVYAVCSILMSLIRNPAGSLNHCLSQHLCRLIYRHCYTYKHFHSRYYPNLIPRLLHFLFPYFCCSQKNISAPVILATTVCITAWFFSKPYWELIVFHSGREHIPLN